MKICGLYLGSGRNCGLKSGHESRHLSGNDPSFPNGPYPGWLGDVKKKKKA